MKKVIIAEDINILIQKKQSFFSRGDIQVFSATTNDEVLNIHEAEKANLIVTKLDMLGMDSEELCLLIRGNRLLRDVSIVIVSPESSPDVERRGNACNANAFIPFPLDYSAFFEKTQRLLNIPKRKAFRVPLSVRVEGIQKSKPFLCQSENISSTGILVETDRILIKGDVISCSFFLPNSLHVRTEGELVRSVKRSIGMDIYQHGIRFINIDPAFQSAIEEYVEERSSQEP